MSESQSEPHDDHPDVPDTLTSAIVGRDKADQLALAYVIKHLAKVSPELERAMRGAVDDIATRATTDDFGPTRYALSHMLESLRSALPDG